jgi:NADPH2:quinone reductase
MTKPRAWLVHDAGAPREVMTLGPPLQADVTDDVVRIEVEACALNFADDLLCRGTYQEKPPKPFTPGLEVAGVVVEAGSGATHGVGNRVAGSPLLPHGALATTCIARSADVFAVPDDMAAGDAAAMHVTYQTGWFALHRRAALREGQTLLVHAGAGGVGSAAIQLGRAAGARVVATAGGPDKVALCRDLGAEVAIDHRSEDFVAIVNDLTGGKGADVIFDPVGGETFDRSRKCIAWEGVILVIGAAGGRYFEAPSNHVLVKNYTVAGLNWGGYRTRAPELVAQAHAELVELYQRGAIRPLVSQVIPLDDAVDGLEAVVTGHTTGKVVVVP